MPSSSPPRVSVIVPSWSGEVARVLKSLDDQSFRDFEVEVVRGVGPAARARNVGTARSRGAILLFVDDDAYLGDSRTLERLVAVLDANPNVAVVGTAKIPPPHADRFQRASARQVPREVYPVEPEDVESNPPLDRYGYTGITTTCCAVRRETFDAVGGFDEGLTTGPEDTEFFYRIRQRGDDIYIAGNTWVYHEPLGNLRDLLRKGFWSGIGHSLEARKHPSRRMNVLRLDRPLASSSSS